MLGPDHPDTATSLNSLAAGYSAQRQYDVAPPLYLRAQSIYEKAFGPNHPNTVLVLKNLAKLRQAEAETLFTEAKAREERAASQTAAKPTPP